MIRSWRGRGRARAGGSICSHDVYYSCCDPDVTSDILSILLIGELIRNRFCRLASGYDGVPIAVSDSSKSRKRLISRHFRVLRNRVVYESLEISSLRKRLRDSSYIMHRTREPDAAML